VHAARCTSDARIPGFRNFPELENKGNFFGAGSVCIGNHSTPTNNTSFEGGGSGNGLSYSRRQKLESAGMRISAIAEDSKKQKSQNATLEANWN
jgi:hypothetical protein